jgi:transcriptional regulator with XRE-family HTH domain
LTAVVAARVKQLRKAQGLSAAALAERMSKAGVPWQREVVANLEAGRRASVSVTELLGLSVVLSVPPVTLLLAPGAAELRYVPMDYVDAYRGLLWLLAEEPFRANAAAWQDAMAPVALVRRHHEQVNVLESYLSMMGARERWAAEGQEGADDRLRLQLMDLQESAAQLRQTRREMRAHGVFVPELAAEIVERAAARGINLDGEEA